MKKSEFVKIVCECHRRAVKRCEKQCDEGGGYINNYCYEECYRDAFWECIKERLCKYDEDCVDEVRRNVKLRDLDYVCF